MSVRHLWVEDMRPGFTPGFVRYRVRRRIRLGSHVGLSRLGTLIPCPRGFPGYVGVVVDKFAQRNLNRGLRA